MKKILLNAKDQVLSKDEMKAIVGGGSECSACGREECRGSCTQGGNTCGWVQGSCQCTYIAEEMY